MSKPALSSGQPQGGQPNKSQKSIGESRYIFSGFLRLKNRVAKSLPLPDVVCIGYLGFVGTDTTTDRPSGTNREGAIMSEWSENAAQRSRERQLAKKIRDTAPLQDKSVLNNQKGRALWSESRSLIARMCEEFNAEPGNIEILSLVSSQTGFTLSCTDHPAMITGTFSGDTIHFSGKNGIR
jgi:hypothetical protein